MSDIEARLLAMATAKHDRDQDRRRAVFERIKREDPAQAMFLQAIAAEFGKPEAIRVRFADGSEYVSGEFASNDVL